MRKISRTWQAGALALASLGSIVTIHCAENSRNVEPIGVYLHQRVLDSRGRETRDLYPNQVYTNEVRAAIPHKLPIEESVVGLSFTLRASPNIHASSEVQEKQYYGTNDIFLGRKMLENTVRHFGGESVRIIDASGGTAGVVSGTNVVARYSFRVDNPSKYAVSDFFIEKARVRHSDGKESKVHERNLKTVVLSQDYSFPVIIVENIKDNDHTYPNGKGVEFYFSVRNQKVLLEMSSDFRNWDVLYSNLETCPSFTLRAIDLGAEPLQFFRIR